MKLQGRAKEVEGGWWYVEVPALDLSTQGKNFDDALVMIADAVESLVDNEGFKAETTPTGGHEFLLGCNMPGLLVALLLKRRREASGFSLAEVAERLGQKSRNAYQRYESGESSPTVEKLDELLRAVNSDIIIGIPR